ncbi:hypothetical protein ACLB1O_29820 [Escherichia coli]
MIYGGSAILAILLWNGITMYQEYRKKKELLAEAARPSLAKKWQTNEQCRNTTVATFP